MDKLNPIRLMGNWVEGYALDEHVEYSEYLGVDDCGHGQFDTKRTYIGQLLYELKYRNQLSNADEIVNLISPFLIKWDIASKVDYIIPAPPSKKRKYQPVYELCKRIGHYLNKPVLYDIIKKDSSIESKNLSRVQKLDISGSIVRKKRFSKRVNLLLVDDLYQSGKTISEMTRILKNDSNINHIYVLTMTKTRR